MYFSTLSVHLYFCLCRQFLFQRRTWPWSLLEKVENEKKMKNLTHHSFQGVIHLENSNSIVHKMLLFKHSKVIEIFHFLGSNELVWMDKFSLILSKVETLEIRSGSFSTNSHFESCFKLKGAHNGSCWGEGIRICNFLENTHFHLSEFKLFFLSSFMKEKKKIIFNVEQKKDVIAIVVCDFFQVSNSRRKTARNLPTLSSGPLPPPTQK